MRGRVWLTAILGVVASTAFAQQPQKLTGTGASKGTAQDRALIQTQVVPAVQAFMRAQEPPCDYEGGTGADVLTGALTGRAANQRLLSFYYCGSGSFGRTVLAVFEKGKLVSTAVVQARGAAVLRAGDLNKNGTNEVIVQSSSGGAGADYETEEVLDFASGRVRSLGSFTTSDLTCQWGVASQAPNLDRDFRDITRAVYVRPGTNPSFLETVERTTCSTQKAAVVRRMASAKSGRSAVQAIAVKVVDPAATAPLLGSAGDILKSSVCAAVVCKFEGKASLPGGVTFLNYSIDPIAGSTAGHKPDGLFSFQVSGKHRMIGFYTSRFVSMMSDDELGLSKALTGRLVKDALGTAMPRTAETAFKNYEGDQTVGFDTSRDMEVRLSNSTVLSNISSSSRNALKKMADINHPYSVAYVADLKFLKTLRSFINRRAPADATRAREQFLAANKITSKKLPDGSTILFPDIAKAPWRVWDEYFAARGFTSNNFDNEPGYSGRTFSLPGLALDGVSFGGQDVQAGPVYLQ